MNTTLDQRLKLLNPFPALQGLPPSALQQLAANAVLRVFPAGTSYSLASSSETQMMLLLAGQAEGLYQDAEGRTTSLGLIIPGDVVGHDSLFAHRLLTNTLQIYQHTSVVQWPIQWLRDQQSLLAGLFDWLQRDYMRRRTLHILSRVPLFSSLPVSDLRTLAEHLSSCSFDRDSVVFEQDSPGNALFLIEQGQFSVEQNGLIIATLSDDDFFGEMALLSPSQAPHNATVRALTPAKCLMLPGAVFAQLVQQHPALESALQSEINRRLNHAQHIQQDPTQQQQLQIAVTRGMLRGSHILARTPALCPPGCAICEESCAARHGQTRLHLNGSPIDTWDVTTSCRQCRVGPECVEACPENALVWDDSGALKITADCTGCGECVPACPYDAITLQPIQLEERQGPLWQLWRRLQRQTSPGSGRSVASKCDFCSDYIDMACISQCPTGSLRLIPVEELFPL